MPLLKGEGAPQAFADRSLTDAQWKEIVSHLDMLPEGLPRERMRLILMMGKSLGMRASEMLDARTDSRSEMQLRSSERGARLGAFRSPPSRSASSSHRFVPAAFRGSPRAILRPCCSSISVGEGIPGEP